MCAEAGLKTYVLSLERRLHQSDSTEITPSPSVREQETTTSSPLSTSLFAQSPSPYRPNISLISCSLSRSAAGNGHAAARSRMHDSTFWEA